VFWTLSSSFTSQQQPVSNKLRAILKVQNGGQLKSLLGSARWKNGNRSLHKAFIMELLYLANGFLYESIKNTELDFLLSHI